MKSDKGQASILSISLDSALVSLESCTMPRQLRIEYPGAMYHVMSRGNRRQDIFLDDVYRQDFNRMPGDA